MGRLSIQSVSPARLFLGVRIKNKHRPIVVRFPEQERVKSLIFPAAKKEIARICPGGPVRFPEHFRLATQFQRRLLILKLPTRHILRSLTITARLNSLRLQSLTPRTAADPPLIAILCS